MEGFLHALYEYAQEKHVPSYLETWEYRRATCDLEEEIGRASCRERESSPV